MLYYCLKVKQLLVSDKYNVQCNRIMQIIPHKKALNLASLAKGLSVRLQTKWQCVRIPL